MFNKNPIIWSDYPDLDIIRVEDTYYMISTTMHFMPGGAILKSYDLVHWEMESYVYESLDNTPGQCLEENKSIYGKGMWAASLRYHKGIFYVCFVANDTGKTYLYTAKDIKGPWSKQYIEGFYHDCSLLFDEDDRVYILYGNKTLYLTELNEELTAPKEGGLHRILATDTGKVNLGYEGAHLYKINGRYYVFLIHWLAEGTKRRTECCLMSDSLEGEFTGRDVLDDDMGYHNAGVAQGGIVDTPEGEWYGMLFQDHGAIGRIPVLVPVHWEQDFPVFGVDGKVPLKIEVPSTRPEYRYMPLADSDDFKYLPEEAGKIHLKKVWQFNHTPDNSLWSVTEEPEAYRIRTGKLSPNVLLAVNTLTQRLMGPVSETSVTVCGSGLKDGDFAGICVLQGCYGYIALTKEKENYYLVMTGKELTRDENIWGPEGGDRNPGREYERIPINGSQATLKIISNFENNKDEADFYYLRGQEWCRIGITQKLHFRLDHFTGARVGLFCYSTRFTGGTADFRQFTFHC